MALLTAQNISHTFDYPLFNNINLILKPKESISVVGVSGCGKSTLLHICATMLKPNNGQILYKDRSIYNLKQKELLYIRRHEIGIIFQSHYLFKGFSAKENIELSNILAQTDFDKNITDALKISNIMHQNIGELSGGQQQRVSIARILSKKPKIIFADEPTGNLDATTAKEVMAVLFDYVEKNSATLMLATHDLHLAKECTHSYELKSLGLNALK